MRSLVSFIFICICTVSVSAATIYVPTQYPTIQSAIIASSNGDTIIVQSGTYVENIDFLGKSILLESEYGPASTTIDGGNPVNPDHGCVVKFVSGEGLDSVIRGFTITNGTGYRKTYGFTNGGGIYCESASPTIENNVVTENFVESSGGGIYCYESGAIIQGNIISNNSANNSSPSGGAAGGGVMSKWPLSSFRMSYNTICNNSASSQYFEANGGGVSAGGGILYNNIIKENSADSGGGVFVSTCANIQDNTVMDNWSNNSGGGIAAHFLNASSIIANNKISDNTANGGGGGISCSSSTGMIVCNMIYNNHSVGSGGGISCTGHFTDPIEINCNTIVANSAVGNGGGIDCWYGAQVNALNSLIWNNEISAPQSKGKEIHVGLGTYHDTVLTIAYSDVRGGNVAPYVVKSASNAVLNWGSGMIIDDPQFYSETEKDYHLCFDSPCRNAGINTLYVETDFESDPRISDYVPDPGLEIIDIGADEFHVHLYKEGNVVPGGNIDIRVVGWPGISPVTLYIGNLLDLPVGTPHGLRWIEWPPYWSNVLGVIPSSGILNSTMQVPTSWNQGEEKYFQSLVGTWGGQNTRFSNYMVLTVQ